MHGDAVLEFHRGSAGCFPTFDFPAINFGRGCAIKHAEAVLFTHHTIVQVQKPLISLRDRVAVYRHGSERFLDQNGLELGWSIEDRWT